MLSFANRFHGHGSLRYVFKNGETVRGRLLTVRYTANPHRRASRFSVSISKKVFKSAVKRNRVRRRIYEIVRHSLPNMARPSDVVLIVTSQEVLTIEHEVLKAATLRALEEAGLSRTP